MKEIGLEGQRKLLEKSVAVVGCGALGTNAANLLARMGVGRLKLIDRDYVELDNLHRQILYGEADAERRLPKAIAAAERLRKVNSRIKIEAVVEDVNHKNVEKLIEDVDLILDGTDNFETRFILNDAAVKLGKKWIFASALATYGMTMNIIPGKSACLRCLMPNPPPLGSLPTCETIGILPSLVTVISSVQVTEALKILMERNYSFNKLFVADVWRREFSEINVKRRKDCPTCVKGEFDFLHGKGIRSMILCGRNAVQVRPERRMEVNLKSLYERLKNIGEAYFNGFTVYFKLNDKEVTVFSDGRAIIKGTNDIKVAKSICSRFIGV